MSKLFKSKFLVMILIFVLMIGFISVGVNNTEASLGDFFIFKWFKSIFNLNKDNSITGNSLKSVSGFVTVTQTQCSTNNDCPSHSHCECQSEGGPTPPHNKERLPIANVIKDITGKTTGCHCVCDDGWYDCDSKTTNGCEKSSTDLNTDNNNCGECNKRCTNGKECVNGECKSPGCYPVWSSTAHRYTSCRVVGNPCNCGHLKCTLNNGRCISKCEPYSVEGHSCKDDCDCQDGLYCSQGHCCPKGTKWNSDAQKCTPSNRCSDEVENGVGGTDGWVFRPKDGQACCFYIGDKDIIGDNQERYDCTRLGLQKCLRNLDNDNEYGGWNSILRPYKRVCVYTTGSQNCEGYKQCGYLDRVELY